MVRGRASVGIVIMCRRAAAAALRARRLSRAQRGAPGRRPRREAASSARCRRGKNPREIGGPDNAARCVRCAPSRRGGDAALGGPYIGRARGRKKTRPLGCMGLDPSGVRRDAGGRGGTRDPAIAAGYGYGFGIDYRRLRRHLFARTLRAVCGSYGRIIRRMSRQTVIGRARSCDWEGGARAHPSQGRRTNHGSDGAGKAARPQLVAAHGRVSGGCASRRPRHGPRGEGDGVGGTWDGLVVFSAQLSPRDPSEAPLNEVPEPTRIHRGGDLSARRPNTGGTCLQNAGRIRVNRLGALRRSWSHIHTGARHGNQDLALSPLPP